MMGKGSEKRTDAMGEWLLRAARAANYFDRARHACATGDKAEWLRLGELAVNESRAAGEALRRTQSGTEEGDEE